MLYINAGAANIASEWFIHWCKFCLCDVTSWPCDDLAVWWLTSWLCDEMVIWRVDWQLISLPNAIMFHPAIWPQQTWAKNWKGCAPFGGRGAGFPSNSVARAEAYLRAKFHLYPSKCLPTIHQRHRQDRTDTQRSDRIGRTVSQMVTQRLGSRHMILLTPWREVLCKLCH